MLKNLMCLLILIKKIIGLLIIYYHVIRSNLHLELRCFMNIVMNVTK